VTKAAPSGGRRYRDTRRRLLVDMQIADWDDRFLSRFEPAMLAEATKRAGADGAMLYFQNHLGLCFWPTRSGVQHRAFVGQDPVREALRAFAEERIPVCAYYSVNFNNRAWLDHPDWRLKRAAPTAMGVLPQERYGIVCLNNPGYRAFVAEQVDEIIDYAPDAVFFDMLWWNGICVCNACHDRWGAPFPKEIDWADQAWIGFQSMREHWLAEFSTELRDRCKARRPDIDVYANFALGLSNWTRAYTFATSDAQDFLGGDFYGGPGEQLLACRLMLNLSVATPEFMTTVNASLVDHERLRPPFELAQKALTSAANGAAMLIIAPIDPDGGINPAALDAAAQAFAEVEPFAPAIGGRAIEDVALYCSDQSKMIRIEGDQPLAAAPASSAPDYPHARALAGACRALERAHIPFGVITRRQLGELARHKVVVLADVARLTAEEIDAFRSFVARGGGLYASGETSLLLADGSGGEDFALADLFGCHAVSTESAEPIYIRPVSAPVREAAAPERFLTHRGRHVRLSGNSSGEVLARLTLPYGAPASGSVEDQHWASIHSSPPWQDEAAPTLVRHAFGAGRVIYSAAPIEAADDAAGERVFVTLVRGLLDQPSLVTDAHASIAITMFEQPDRTNIFLLNRNPQPWTDSIGVALRSPPGRRAVAVTSGASPLPFEAGPEGVSCTINGVDRLTVLSIHLQNENET